MPTINYRWDYLKVIIVHPTGTFHSYYGAMRDAAAKLKVKGLDWDRSHSVQAFHSMEANWERTCVEVWGEAAELVKHLPWHPWHEWVQRLDVRATLWEVEEDAVMQTGERLNRYVMSWNVETFNSKKASKRKGRDRGGRGFRLGSRKSDLCIVVYKRAQEPAAQEFRFQGAGLRNAIHRVDDALGLKSQVLDLWLALGSDLERKGAARFERGLDQAGIGTYWPLFDHKGVEDYSGLQRSFATFIATEDAHDHADFNWDGQHPVELDLAPPSGPVDEE